MIFYADFYFQEGFCASAHLREKFISAVHMQLADRQGRKCGFRPAALLPDPSGKLGELHSCADILPLVQIGREIFKQPPKGKGAFRSVSHLLYNKIRGLSTWSRHKYFPLRMEN